MNRRSLLSLAILAGCSDAGVTKFNNEPTADITSHRDGDTVREGESATLTGVVGDANDALNALSPRWLIAGAAVCADSVVSSDGVVQCEHTFQVGDESVVFEVSDPQGASGSDRVELVVQATDAPTAQISSPEAVNTYYSDQLIPFLGTVEDGEDAPEALTVSWEGELGDLGLDIDVSSDGAVSAYGRLSEGEHQVKLRVVDTSGKEAQDSVVVIVGPPNSAPTCSFTAPPDGSAGPQGDEVRFEGEVADADVAADTLTVTWVSNLDGTLGASTPDTNGRVRFAWNDLSLGTHLVTLTATDEAGATCNTSVYYTVGNPPVLTLTSPGDGDVYNEGETVTFAGTVSDSEDQPNDVALSWVSDLDGEFSMTRADSSGAVDVRTSALSSGDHTISVTATDSDGLYVVRTVAIAINALPTAPSIVLSPDPAGTDDALIALASGSIDPDSSGTVTYAYTWYEDGVLSTASTSSVFPSASTTKAHTYHVVVTPNDGTGDGSSGEAELTITNSDPQLSGPTVSPTTGVVGDTLTCAATATDPDGDSPTLSYTWNDGSIGSTYVIVETDDPGDTITCTASADDGDGGSTGATASALVSNSDPTFARPHFIPTGDVWVSETIRCKATIDDPDGGTPTETYLWSDGSTSDSYTVVSSDDPGDTIECTITATDADGGSASTTISTLVINTDPVVSSVAISPSSAHQDDTVTCMATASDEDGGTPTIAYVWSNANTGAVLGTGASVDLSTLAITSTDTIECTATASDVDGGTSAGVSATLTITNRSPSVSVILSPTTPRTNDVITATATATDADGDALTITYDWAVDGVVVQSGSAATLAGSTFFAKNQEVSVDVRANDGAATTTTTSSTLVVENTPPGAPAISVTPSAPADGDDLLCTLITASTDADTDTITYTMAWTVDGAAFAGADTTSWPDDTVDGANVSAGETWTCTVTPDDGDDAGSTVAASVTTSSSSYSGTISMPSTSTVDGFDHGEWSTLNSGGRVASRLRLTEACVNPILAFYQHSSADTSIQGSYYVMDAAGTVLAYTPYATYSGCHDCWLPHPTALSVTMAAGTTYYLGFQNGVGAGDMSGPSIYLDATARTVGIATFDDPRADKPTSNTRGLPTTTVSWQQRWQIDCE